MHIQTLQYECTHTPTHTQSCISYPNKVSLPCINEKNAAWQPPSCWLPPSIIDHIWRKTFWYRCWRWKRRTKPSLGSLYRLTPCCLLLGFQSLFRLKNVYNPAASSFLANSLRLTQVSAAPAVWFKCVQITVLIKAQRKTKTQAGKRVNRRMVMMLVPNPAPRIDVYVSMWMYICVSERNSEKQNNTASLAVRSLHDRVTAH